MSTHIDMGDTIQTKNADNEKSPVKKEAVNCGCSKGMCPALMASLVLIGVYVVVWSAQFIMALIEK